MGQYSLFKVTSITVNGVAIAIADNSVRVTGLKDHESSVVPSGTGADYETHTRVPRTISGQIQFGPNVKVSDLDVSDARIVLKDSKGPRRILAPNCTLARFGEAGGCPVDVMWNVLEPFEDV